MRKIIFPRKIIRRLVNFQWWRLANTLCLGVMWLISLTTSLEEKQITLFMEAIPQRAAFAVAAKQLKEIRYNLFLPFRFPPKTRRCGLLREVGSNFCFALALVLLLVLPLPMFSYSSQPHIITRKANNNQQPWKICVWPEAMATATDEHAGMVSHYGRVLWAAFVCIGFPSVYPCVGACVCKQLSSLNVMVWHARFDFKRQRKEICVTS